MPEPTVSDRTDSPAVALGPTSLVLGALSAVGAWVPALAFVTLPWGFIAGALAVTFGTSGIYYARHGDGRMWTAAAGTTLGTIGLTGTVTLIWAFTA
ncbi:hypothetical protein J7E88_27460 [Streptomyces sp. ISL-10]|uniref:hypothetical protein n=1 Tax=Streptomyces sp. ISL-10 TaxID=2819172 RepID=UPI001BE5E0B5|nr:hypothetical protein [Streptomyces sp. ISL-10]MBT2368951.1 hypothetical protein [Streptomyces sp. ISL-10]